MNRIDQLFKEKDKNILSIYFTAGFPELNNTSAIIESLEQSGADLIEVGMPFSDPLADGPIIQESSTTALNNGMTLTKLFDQLKNIRKSTYTPLILMGYINPVLKFGIERFCKKCQETGIDGVILPDLPLEVYASEYIQVFDYYGIHNIMLITPQSSEERIKLVDAYSKGFIYMVSSSSTTGNKVDTNGRTDYYKRIGEMKLKNPVLAGFGIYDNRSFEHACNYVNGGIIGTAFIKRLSEGFSKGSVEGFITGIRNPIPSHQVLVDSLNGAFVP